MTRKAKTQKHGSDNTPDMRNNVSSSAPPAEEEYRVGPGRPPKEHQWKPGQSGNPKGAKRKKRSLIPELKEQFERVFSQKLKVTQGDRAAIHHQVGGRPGAAFHSVCQGRPACASRRFLLCRKTGRRSSDINEVVRRHALRRSSGDPRCLCGAANAGKGHLCLRPCACAARTAR